MDAPHWQSGSPLVTAMIGSAAVGAQYIAGKAARDAVFLARYEASALPSMIIWTAIFSIGLVVASSKGLRKVAPGRWVPIAFAASAILYFVEWGLTSAIPGASARILYLQVSGLGPMLGSGFWLIASERFDPHTAKKRFGQIAGAGTVGGLLGGLAAARVATLASIGAMLPLLALLNVACAWQCRQLSRSREGASPVALKTPRDSTPARSGLRVLAEARYLRSLAVLVMLGTMSAIFVDQVFKTQAKAVLGRGANLGSFFSLYYSAISLITFAVQTFGSRLALERLGLAAAAGSPAFTLLIGGAVALLAPGFRTVVAMRGGEAISRGSLFRAGYELFYTPIAPKDKRAVKSIIDVGVDRSGDIIGAMIIQRLLWISQPGQTTVLLSLAMGCSTGALIVSSLLKRGYSQTLEQNLLNRAVELDLSDVEDLTTRTALIKTLRTSQGRTNVIERSHGDETKRTAATPIIPAGASNRDIQDILTLQSRDRDAALRVLRNENGLPGTLVPHVIPLVAWDAVANDCVRALRSVAEERVGVLIDALLDPNQPFAVRRRLPRVFSVCVSQRATDGLLLGLEDLRFEVRFQCGRSLLAIVEKNPRVRIDKAQVFAIVQKEVAVSTDVWQNRKLLDGLEDGDGRSLLEDLIKDRASQSLAHVFTLLALVLPTEPMRIAFRGLHTNDQGLRGTALEYLEGVLPSSIREPLWPFLEVGHKPSRPARPREEALAELLRSNQSIMLNLEELRRRAGGTTAEPQPGPVQG